MPVTGTPDQLRKGRGSSGFCLFSLRKIPCAYFLSMSVKPAPLSCFHNFSTGLLHIFAKNRGKPAQILRASGLFLFPGFALASLRRIKPADPPVFRRHLFNDDRGGRGIFPEHAHQKVGGARNQFFFLFNGGGFIEIPRGNPRLQTREESRPSFLSSVKNIFRFSRSESFL